MGVERQRYSRWNITEEIMALWVFITCRTISVFYVSGGNVIFIFIVTTFGADGC